MNEKEWQDGDRKNLKVGDRVKPTKEYLETVNKNDFTATIVRWLFPKDDSCADLAELKIDGKKYTEKISAYWLELDPCATCALGIDKVCIKAEE